MITNLFQTIGHFGFSRYIVFDMHLDIHYVEIHSKNYVSRKAKTTYSLDRREYVLLELEVDINLQIELALQFRTETNIMYESKSKC